MAKKQIDPKTTELFNAVKKAYIDNIPGIIQNNTTLQPITIDMAINIVENGQGYGMEIDSNISNHAIDIMPNYQCGLFSLPRIYKQVARLAGEKCEDIIYSVGRHTPFGITQKAAAENKKLINIIKKFCKQNAIRPYIGYVYHDASRRCAVWSDSHVLIISKALYNPECAGLMIDKDGYTPKDEIRYPKYQYAFPEYKCCNSVDTKQVKENVSIIAKCVKTTKNSEKRMLLASRNNTPLFVNVDYTIVFDALTNRIYFDETEDKAIVSPIGNNGDGYILLMPMSVDTNINYIGEGIIYINPETDYVVKGKIPYAERDSINIQLPPVVTENAETPSVEQIANEHPQATADTTALIVLPDTTAEQKNAAADTPAGKKDPEELRIELRASVIRCLSHLNAKKCAPLPQVDTYEIKNLSANSIMIICPRRGASALVSVNDGTYSAVSIETGKLLGHGWRMGDEGRFSHIEAMQKGIATAIEYFKEMPALQSQTTTADTPAEQKPAADNTPAEQETAADDTPAGTTAQKHMRLTSIARRMWRAAAVLIPLLIVSMLIAATGRQTPQHTTGANHASANSETTITVNLETVTITPPPAKKSQTSNQIVDNNEKVCAHDNNTPQAFAPSEQLTQPEPIQTKKVIICAGTPWEYNMMNWA